MKHLSRHAKRARVTRPSPSSAKEHAGGGDLISGLCDDLLVRILELVADDSARDAVRTGALSRRWRGLWARVPGLRFASWPEFKSAGGVRRFIDLVDGVLALRASAAQPPDAGVMKHLEIALRAYRAPGPGKKQRLVVQSVRAAEGWARYAARHGVRSFVLNLRLPLKQWQDQGDDDDYDNDDDWEKETPPLMTLGDLPSSAKLETMYLALAGARLRLPATAVFESLVDLTLRHIEVSPRGGRLLARLVSPACCPRLQKLRLVRIRGLKKLVLDTGSLLELSVAYSCVMGSVELKTPNLRVLHFDDDSYFEVLTGSAPRLEELAIQCGGFPIDINDGDLSCVRSLKFELLSHRDGDDDDGGSNEDTISLLERCTSARDLVVYLDVPERQERRQDLIRDGMPQLPHITSLAVHFSYELHSVGDGVASLLTRFKNIRYLRIQVVDFFVEEDYSRRVADNFVCDHPEEDWKSNDISLAHLEEAEFTGLTGTKCELRFLQFVLASAKDLRKLVIRFSDMCSLVGKRDYFEHMLIEGGMWTPCCDTNESYEWRPS
ncbi:hypothetical protein ACP4OV_007908 [Aristida adscensionis]